MPRWSIAWRSVRRPAPGYGEPDRTVKIWDTATGNELFALKGQADHVSSVAFSPDGQRLATGSFDRTVKIWDSATGNELFALKGQADHYELAFSPDGRRLASASLTVKIWDHDRQGALRPQGPCRFGQERGVQPGRPAPGYGEPERTVRSGIRDRQGALTLKGHDRPVMSVAFSPDGQSWPPGDADRAVKIWDGATGKELFALEGHAGSVMSVAFSPDGQHLASGSRDQTVKIWDSATGKELFAFKGHADSVRSVAFSPDGQRLATAGGDTTVKIWDTTPAKEGLFTLRGHADWIISVAFSPDGQVAASEDHTVKIWDTTTGKELFALRGHPMGS